MAGVGDSRTLRRTSRTSMLLISSSCRGNARPGPDSLLLPAKCIQGRREGRKGALDHSLENGDGHSIVRDGDRFAARLRDAREHLTAGEHAAAAMDDQSVAREIRRIVPSRACVDGHVCPDILSDPAGYL